MRRKQIDIIRKDLEKKIVFIVGPRQVGKTWLAKEIAKEFPKSVYLNYDNSAHREIIKKESWLPSTDLLILDEIHKMKGWKNYVKGVFDTRPSNMRILVTGSARLNAQRGVGDSLAGRFFAHHLMPFTLSELNATTYEGNLPRILERGGFPEPFLAPTNEDANRWRANYADSLLRQDVLDFENVSNWLAMRHVFDVLKLKVGSPISYSSIARDIGISPTTVKRYIAIFEALYMVFRVVPYSNKITRSILKEPKVYFYDHGFIENDGARFENMVAVGLLKKALGHRDATGEEKTLAFLKTKEKKEVDFALVDHTNTLEHIIEAKISDDTVSKGLRYFVEKYKVPATQVVLNLKNEYRNDSGIEIRHADRFLSEM